MFFSVNNKKKICFSGKLDCHNKAVVFSPMKTEKVDISQGAEII